MRVIFDRVRSGAAQQRTDTRKELLEREGLRQVIVSTSIKTCDPVGNSVARSQHEHRPVVPGRTQGTAHTEAVKFGHHHVEDGQIRLLGTDHVQRLFPILGQAYLVPVEAEGALERIADGLLVVSH